LPQIVSDELLVLLLQIFKISGNPNLRVGYNSMGADCIANNLHFHLVFADKLFPDSKMFPIEQAAKRLFLSSSLKHKTADEINMYNVGVKMADLGDAWPVRAFVMSPDLQEG